MESNDQGSNQPGGVVNSNVAGFNQSELNVHNQARAKHGASPLRLFTSSLAQSYADELAREWKFEHNPNNQQFGENLYYVEYVSEDPNGVQYQNGEASQGWYDEEVDYDYSTHSSKNGNMVGHFTQMVWKATTAVAFGIAKGVRPSSEGAGLFDVRFTVVAIYQPPGNYGGEYEANVMRPGSSLSNNDDSSRNDDGSNNDYGSSNNDDAKIGGITPAVLSFRGRCEESPWNI